MKLFAAANFCARRSRFSAYTARLRGPCLRNAVPCPCLSAEPGALHRTVEFDDRITHDATSALISGFATAAGSGMRHHRTFDLQRAFVAVQISVLKWCAAHDGDISGAIHRLDIFESDMQSGIAAGGVVKVQVVLR